MNTQETNTIIAEFMGLDIISLEQFLVGVQSTIARIKIGRKDYICPMVEGYLLEHLQYHKSWDWLMPVVKKCFQSTLEYGEVIYPLPYHKINNALLTVNREDVYTEVVEFIKYLNRKEDAMKK